MEKESIFVVNENAKTSNSTIFEAEAISEQKENKTTEYFDSSKSVENRQKDVQKSKMSLDQALEKYFEPSVAKLTKKYKQTEILCDDIMSSIKVFKPKMKFRLLKIIAKVAVSLVGGFFLHRLLIPMLAIVNPALQIVTLLGLCAGVFGVLEGAHMSIRAIRTKSKRKKMRQRVEQLKSQLESEQDSVAKVIASINSLSKIATITDEQNLIDTGCVLAGLNQKLAGVISKLYSNSLSVEMMETLKKYDDITYCHQNVQAILTDLNAFRTQLKKLPTSKLNMPDFFAQKHINVIESYRETLSHSLTNAIIPFTQVINVNTKRITDSFEKKLAEAKLREKTERELKQERENETYKEFFKEFGIDASLYE